jgi:hypothetical protein
LLVTTISKVERLRTLKSIYREEKEIRMDDDTQATQLYSVPANTNIVRRLSTGHNNYSNNATSQNLDNLCFVGSQRNEASRVLAKIILQYADKPDVECNATVNDLEKGIYIGAYSDADIVIDDASNPIINKAKFRLTLVSTSIMM